MFFRYIPYIPRTQIVTPFFAQECKCFATERNVSIEAKQVSKASMRHNAGNLQKSLTEHTAHHKACKRSFFYYVDQLLVSFMTFIAAGA